MSRLLCEHVDFSLAMLTALIIPLLNTERIYLFLRIFSTAMHSNINCKKYRYKNDETITKIIVSHIS